MIYKCLLFFFFAGDSTICHFPIKQSKRSWWKRLKKTLLYKFHNCLLFFFRCRGEEENQAPRRTGNRMPKTHYSWTPICTWVLLLELLLHQNVAGNLCRRFFTLQITNMADSHESKITDSFLVYYKSYLSLIWAVYKIAVYIVVLQKICKQTLMREIQFLFNECWYNASLTMCVICMKVLQNLILMWIAALLFHWRKQAQTHKTHTFPSVPRPCEVSGNLRILIFPWTSCEKWQSAIRTWLRWGFGCSGGSPWYASAFD